VELKFNDDDDDDDDDENDVKEIMIKICRVTFERHPIDL